MSNKEIVKVLLGLESDLYKLERLNSIIDITATALASDEISCSDPNVTNVLVEVSGDQKETIASVGSVIKQLLSEFASRQKRGAI